MVVNLYDSILNEGYFDLELVGNISINYDINSLPTCEITVICTEKNKIDLEEGLKQDTLPLFLNQFKPDSIFFSENNTHQDPFLLYTANIIFTHFLKDDLDKPFNPVQVNSSWINGMILSNHSVDFPIKISNLKIVPVEAPIVAYRSFNVFNSTDYITTTYSELAYLYENYGLIINQKELIKGRIVLIPYGKKIKTHTLDPEYILDRKLSTIPSMNFKIQPTIIWRGKLLNTDEKKEGSMRNISDFKAFYIKSSPVKPTNSLPLNNDSEANPYSTTNPFSIVSKDYLDTIKEIEEAISSEQGIIPITPIS